MNTKTIITLAAALASASCSSTRENVESPVANGPIDTGAFRHDQHLAIEQDGRPLGCESCHPAHKEAKYKLDRPGKTHAPCDGCHADAFYAPPGKLCEVCHLSVDPFHAGKSPLHDYPRGKGRAELISAFDHKSHLKRNEDRVQEGGAFVCEACHRVTPESAYATFPTHEICAFCHEAVATPRMASCRECHAGNGPEKGRHFVGNDIRFTHGKHRSDPSGKRIDCAVCHSTVKDSQRASELALPKMQDCAQCHENSERTPERVRITSCGVCHMSDVNSVALPGDHTAQRTVPWDRIYGSIGGSR